MTEEQLGGTTPEAEEPVAEEAPAPRRGRRKRGRVVAPAGPPRATASGSGDSADQPAEVPAG